MNTLRRLISRYLIAIVAVIAVFSIAKVELSAQSDAPTGYCVPKEWVMAKGFMYTYYYCYFDLYPDSYGYLRGMGNTVSYIKIYNKASGDVVLYNNSGDNPFKGPEGTRCYHYYGENYEGTKQMAPGEEYVIEMRIKGWQYAFSGFDYCTYLGSYYYTHFNTRLFIDWNRDADWTDASFNGLPNTNEYVKWWGEYNDYKTGSYCEAGTLTYTFKVPDDAEGKTRIRIMACGPYSYYPYAADRPNPCVEGYYYQYSVPGYSYASASVYGETEDYVIEFAGGIKNSFPDEKAPNNILYAGEKYDGTTRARKDDPDGPKLEFKRPMYEIGSPMKEGTTLSYQIYGPYPLGSDESQKLVFEALDPNSSTPNPLIDMSGSKWNTQKIFYINKSRGKYSPGGTGTFQAEMGGTYEVRYTINVPTKQPKVIKKKFTVAWANDIMATAISSPITDGFPRYYKYPVGMTIPVLGAFTNSGLNVVKKFNANAKIYDDAGSIVFEKDLVFDPANDENYVDLVRFGAIILDFGSYKPSKVAQYKMVITADLKSATDMETYNNRFPRIDEANYTFATADQFEAEAYSITVPKDGSAEIVAGRPFMPVADIKNKGISDIGNVYVNVTFTHKTEDYHKSSDATMESLPQGPEGANTRTIKLPSVTLDRPGMYDGLLEIAAPGDGNPKNDKLAFTFEVLDAIGGVFTVGKGQNFETIEDAMSALYKTGIKKPIVLELTDKEYTLGSLTNTQPAWDFSSYIRGVDKDNTITVRPSSERAIARGGVTINMYSKNGVGLLFGQSRQNKYPTAIINDELQANQLVTYAQSAGFITIDGGKNKAFNFVMHSGNPIYSAAINLQYGASNVNISNCLINNADNNSSLDYIPGSNYDPTNGSTYEDNYALTNGYSAGIANRATILQDMIVVTGLPQAQSNFTGVDFEMLPNSNNKFTNNEITGFGIGILSIGLGPVLYKEKENGEIINQKIDERYNENTLIENNLFKNIGSTGIFLGYEKNAVVNKNLISKINSVNNAFGIRLGGTAHKNSSGLNYVGYNNIGTIITANRITDVTAKNIASGVFVEQSKNSFVTPDEKLIAYPTSDDNINIESNAIWNVNGNQNLSKISGIAVMKERSTAEFGTLKNADQVFTGLSISNNTISLNSNITGDIAGLAVFAINDAQVFNNAVTVKGTGNGANQAALMFMGNLPEKGGLQSDYNAVYTTGTVDAVRFIEASIMKNDDDENFLSILNMGQANEFETIRQWYAWTGQDKHTIYGVDFNKDFNFSATDINVNDSPKLSVLSNRGQKFTGSHTDLHGLVRGMSGERYDIGAVEFVGTDKVLDYEATLITSPLAYFNNNGKFTDAEYVMTTEPINVSAMIRNNGSVQEENIPVEIKIYRLDPIKGWVETATHTTKAKANSGDFADVNPDFSFKVETLAELDEASPRAEFYGMEENVTPLYKVSINVGYDQYGTNNLVEQVYRFYVRRANEFKLVQSNTLMLPNADAAGDANTLAAALNANAVKQSLKDINMYNVSRKEAEANKLAEKTTDISYRQDMDIFNRNAWPERSVDYSIYKSVVLADGDNTTLTRYEKQSIFDFLNSGDETHKKNLMLSSEEIARNQYFNNWKKGYDLDIDLNAVLHVEPRFPYSPLGKDKAGLGGVYADYSGKTVTGVNVAGHETFAISRTSNTSDKYPMPGLFDLVNGLDGKVYQAYKYNSVENPDFPEGARIMGGVYTSVDKNVTVLGVDWRHFSNVGDVMRANIDFMNQHGGMINPIELYSFDAKAVGNRVELVWSTASEMNSSKFDIERKSGNNFAKISDKSAAGNSSVLTHYNFTDINVMSGNEYTYRLKMYDNDGTFTYSKEEVVKLDGALLTIGEVTPNPVRNISKLQLNTAESTTITVEIFNEAGVKISSVFNGIILGSKELEINANDLSSGTYIVIISNGVTAVRRTLSVVK